MFPEKANRSFSLAEHEVYERRGMKELKREGEKRNETLMQV